MLKSEAAFRAHPVWASAPGEHQQQAIEVSGGFCFTCYVSSELHSPLASPMQCSCQVESCTDVRLLQGLEKYLMTKLYGKVFAVSESDRERDEALARRMEVGLR